MPPKTSAAAVATHIWSSSRWTKAAAAGCAAGPSDPRVSIAVTCTAATLLSSAWLRAATIRGVGSARSFAAACLSQYVIFLPRYSVSSAARAPASTSRLAKVPFASSPAAAVACRGGKRTVPPIAIRKITAQTATWQDHLFMENPFRVKGSISCESHRDLTTVVRRRIVSSRLVTMSIRRHSPCLSPRLQLDVTPRPQVHRRGARRARFRFPCELTRVPD